MLAFVGNGHVPRVKLRVKMGNETSLDWAFTTAPSLWRMAAQMQIETVALISRRAQAYMELPQKLAYCHSPEDLLREQVCFWQIAQRHYMQGLDKSLSTLGSQSAPEAESATATPRLRDYMVVSETVQPAAAKETAKPQLPREQGLRVRKTA